MITLHRLTKRYGAFTAVDRVGFEVPGGSVVGLLGPNGAGKSTLLRMAVGLASPTSGTAHILGRPYADLTNPGRQVGVLIDAAAQHAGRTGREILRLNAALMGLTRTRADEVLALVGLTEVESRRRLKNYSLGMRQRLGVANALLGDPEVLILDEPANGLDPAGIHWMRGLLRGFADRGGAVLVSSHLLREVESIADQVVIMGRGQVMAQGRTADLQPTRTTVVRAEHPDELATALDHAGVQVLDRTGTSLNVTATPETVGRIAHDSDLVLFELRSSEGSSLEDLFLNLTAGHDRKEAA